MINLDGKKGNSWGGVIIFSLIKGGLTQHVLLLVSIQKPRVEQTPELARKAHGDLAKDAASSSEEDSQDEQAGRPM